jgi:hypothetical protein
MKKRFLSSVLALAMLFGGSAILPTNGISENTAISASAEEDGKSFNTAQKIQFNTSYTDALLNYGDEIYYVFNLPSAGKINLSFGREYSDKGSGWNVKIYNQYQECIHDEDIDKGTSKTAEICSIGLPKGKGYIKVSGGTTTADYTINVKYKKSSFWETEVNNSFEDADSIKIGNTYYGTMCYFGENFLLTDVDYYKVNIPKSGYYYFSFGREYSNEGQGWDITIYNHYQEEVFSQRFDNGTSKTDTIKIKLSSGTNYLKVEPTSDDWFVATTADYRFRLTYRLNNATISNLKTAYTYTGKAIVPTVKLSYGGTTLKKGTDYTVTCKNNKNAGIATIIIKGKGNYSGTVKKTFKILPKQTTIAATASPKKGQIRVRWKKNSQASAYQIMYSTNSKFKNAHSAYVKSSYTAKTISANVSAGKKYYVKVRAYKKVGTSKVFGKWSAVKTVTAKK